VGIREIQTKDNEGPQRVNAIAFPDDNWVKGTVHIKTIVDDVKKKIAETVHAASGVLREAGAKRRRGAVSGSENILTSGQ
jgi:hypothetical protein